MLSTIQPNTIMMADTSSLAENNFTTSFIESTLSFSMMMKGNAPGVDTTPFRILGIVIGITDIILGSSGNLMTFIAILSNKKLHKPFHIFIANLCCIDFLTASAMMPFNVVAYYTKTWPFGNESFTCSFMAFSYYCCGYSSIVCLLVITANRFIGIVFPEHYDQLFSKNRIIFTIILSWLFAPAFMAPFFFFTGGGFGWYPKLTLCVFLTADYNQQQKMYMQFTRILFQALPLLIMIILYSKIFFTSKNSGRAVSEISLRGSSCHDTPSYSRPFRSFLRKTNILSPDACNCCSTKTIDSNADFKANHGENKNFIKSSPVTTTNNEFRQTTSLQHSRITESLAVVKPESVEMNSQLQLSKRGADSEVHNSINQESRRNSAEENEPNSTPSHCLVVSMESGYAVSSVLNLKRNFSDGGASSTLLKNNDTPILHRSPNTRPSRRGKYPSAIRMVTRKRKKMDMRLLRISLTICVAFMILFLPSVIINLTPISDPRVHMFASVITWFNSCVNPIIYCFMNAKMREQYKLLLLKAFNAICRCMSIKESNLELSRHSTIHSSSKIYS